MSWLYKLERRYRNFGVPNLMMYIIASMAVVFLMQTLMGMPVSSWIAFNRTLVLQGEIWRIFTFTFMPPGNNIFFTIIALYFYYFVGSSLENSWGTFRFTVYYLLGVAGAIIGGLISGFIDNTYLNFSLFFAFAMLFPNNQILLFFVIPVKVKYIAFAVAVFFGISLLGALTDGNIPMASSIAFSFLNFFLFFGGDIMKQMRQNAKYSKRRRDFKQNMHNNNNMWR